MTNMRLVMMQEAGEDVPCIELTDEAGTMFDLDVASYVVLSALRDENREAYERLVGLAGLLVEQADWTDIQA